MILKFNWLNRQHLALELALAFMIAALGILLVFERGGGVWRLTLIPLAVLPTLSGSRWASAAGISAAVVLNFFLPPLESFNDLLVNALLLASTGALSYRVFGQHQALMRSRAPSFSGRAGRVVDAIFRLSPRVTLDERGAVVSMTPSARRMFGFESGVAIGRPFASLVDNFTPGGLAAAGGSRWVGRRIDGDPFLLDIASTTTIREGASLSVLHLTSVGQSRKDRHPAPTPTEQMYGVWRLNSLGLMAATLAHEISQPLTAASNYVHSAQTDMVRAGPLGDSASRTLGMAKYQILRAGQIINKMHDLLAVDSGSRGPERLGDLILQLAPILDPMCRDADVNLRIRIDPGSDTVCADGSQIQQVIVNLVRNAVQAVSGRPDREVKVSGRCLSAEFYELVVEDSGPGFGDVSRQPRRGNGDTFGSLGLGLVLARSLVERQGGVLSVGRSSDLGGAAVRFTLARKAEEVFSE